MGSESHLENSIAFGKQFALDDVNIGKFVQINFMNLMDAINC